MSSKPLVAVIGSTGNQGLSVAKSLLATGKYRVRGLTRNVDSATSKSLIAQGAEMVKANLNNHDEIKRAFQGANIVFAVTNFWDPEIVGGDQTLEVRQGKLIADVAKETGVEWLFWSSLPDTNAGSNGALKHVLHFDGKNQVEQYIRKLGIPATFIYVGFYMTNFDGFFPKVTNPDGSQEIAMPFVTENTPIPLVDPPKDVGPIVAAILEDREQWRGKAVPVAGERITFGEAAKIISEYSGVRTTIRALDAETIKDFPGLNNEEMIEMCKWFGIGYYGETEARDISVAKKLHPGITTFRQFCAEKYGKK
jgi:uncharacterized protein YbjT (DUF2867 family)